MQIINRLEIAKFKRIHPQSRKPLGVWEKIMVNHSFKNFNDLRKVFPSADYLPKGNYTVFNISGNKYRLITQINYLSERIKIVVVWTHNEYSHPKNDAMLRGGKA